MATLGLIGRALNPVPVPANVESVLDRCCSLIPGLGVKLSITILAGPTVLSAVGACPPHDGVRRRWWINVASAVSLNENSQKIGSFRSFGFELQGPCSAFTSWRAHIRNPKTFSLTAHNQEL